MDDQQLYRFDKAPARKGKPVLCSILATVAGLLNVFALPCEILMPMPSLLLLTVFSGVLYVCGGIVPLVIALTAGSGVMMLFGWAPALASMALHVPTAVVLVLGIRKQTGFFVQLKRSVLTAVLSVGAAVGMLTLIFGPNLIARISELMESQYEAQKQVLWMQVQRMLLNYDLHYTLEEFSREYLAIMTSIESYYEYNLLANLLSGSILTALLGCLWANWLAARRGNATPDSYRPLCDWYLPRDVTLGLLLMLAAALILSQTQMAGAAKACNIVASVCTAVFSVAAFAALDRRQKRGGASHGRRIASVILTTIALTLMGSVFLGINAFVLLAAGGAFSALFGERGALRAWIDSHKDENGD